jgi:HemY protein
MRRLFILVLITLLAAVGLVALIQSDPGYVLISFGRTTMETSLWVGLVLLLLFNLLFYLGFRLLRKLSASNRVLSGWFSDRSTSRLRRQTRHGLLHFARAEWRRSRRLLERAAPNADSPLLNYLFAARASYRLDDTETAHGYFEAALRDDAESLLPVCLTRAELELKTGESEQALATLELVSSQSHPQLSFLTARACLALERWEQLAQLLPALGKNKAVPSAILEEMETRAWDGLLKNAASEGEAQALEQLWRRIPEVRRKQGGVLATYLRGLLNCGADADVEKLLARILRKQWDEELVGLYGLARGADSPRQMKMAQGWLKNHSDSAGLLLTLGRLALRGQQWDQARDYFANSAALQPSEQASAELGRLLASQGRADESGEHYRDAFDLLGGALPDFPQPESPAPEQAPPNDAAETDSAAENQV